MQLQSPNGKNDGNYCNNLHKDYNVAQRFTMKPEIVKVETVTVRLPRDVTAWLDSLVEIGIFKSRSEAIREFVRDFLRGHRGSRSLSAVSNGAFVSGYERS